jgi:hypothetical protein
LELQQSFACDERLEGNDRNTGQVIVAADNGFQLLIAGGNEPAFFSRIGSVIFIFLDAMLEIPDAVVHSFGIEVDKTDFFRRAERRNCSAS